MAIGEILRELCKWKGVNILETEVCPDHIYMLLEIPLKMSVSSFMGFLKGKSSLMIYERYGNEIQISEQGVLVPRLLCRHGREEHRKNKRVYSEAVKRGPVGKPIDTGRSQPVYG